MSIFYNTKRQNISTVSTTVLTIRKLGLYYYHYTHLACMSSVSLYALLLLCYCIVYICVYVVMEPLDFVC